MGVSRIFWLLPLLAEVQKKRGNHEGKPQSQWAGWRDKKMQLQRGDGASRTKKPLTQGVWWDTDWRNLPKLGTAVRSRGPAFTGKLTLVTEMALVTDARSSRALTIVTEMGASLRWGLSSRSSDARSSREMALVTLIGTRAGLRH